jgi:predicted dinucleotide-binding enzyme
MRIAIIGAGRVGTTLGQRWAERGHDIVYGVRDPAHARHAHLEERTDPARAVVGVDAVVVALPWDATEAVVSGLPVGDAVVIDATNSLAANARELAGHPELSGAELIAGWIPSKRVVKAFNITGAANMARPDYPGGRPALLIAGDDPDAKSDVLGLAAEIGFDAVDAGPLTAAADLEHLAMLWIRLAYTLGHGPDIAFSLLRR